MHQAQKCCGWPLPAWFDIAHQTPDAFGAGIFRAGVQIGQAEHVAELVAEDADVGHAVAAFLHDEVRQAAALVRDVGAVRPVEPAARRLHAAAGVQEKDAVEFLQRIAAVLVHILVERSVSRLSFSPLSVPLPVEYS